MIYFVLTIHVIVCLLLIVIILLQHGKSADLAATFGGQGSETAFGPRGAATALSRGTTWLAIVWVITTLSLTVLTARSTPAGSHSVLGNQSAGKATSTPAPASSTPAPASSTPAK